MAELVKCALCDDYHCSHCHGTRFRIRDGRAADLSPQKVVVCIRCGEWILI